MIATSTHDRSKCLTCDLSKEVAFGVKALNAARFVHGTTDEDVQLWMPDCIESSQPTSSLVVVTDTLGWLDGLGLEVSILKDLELIRHCSSE